MQSLHARLQLCIPGLQEINLAFDEPDAPVLQLRDKSREHMVVFGFMKGEGAVQ